MGLTASEAKNTSMRSFTTPLSFLALSAVSVLAQEPTACKPVQTTINWSACNGTWSDPGATSYQCGSMTVPLDYANCAAGNAQLAVMKYFATATPKLGTIFVNPGGPGGSGLQYIYQAGALLSANTGAQYDIVSWDPRGVGKSTPAINCFNNSNDTIKYANSIAFDHIEARGNFTNAKGTDPDQLAFLSSQKETDQTIIEVGNACLKKHGANLKYVGTMATVRDMLALADVIDGAGKTVNYWGISYGTVIGAYFINKFPSRVGRVIIDGVVDSVAWSQQQQYKSIPASIKYSPTVETEFARACAAAGTACAIAQKNSTQAGVTAWIQRLMDSAYDAHAADPTNDQIPSSSAIRTFLAGNLYQPIYWSQGAQALAAYAQALNITDLASNSVSNSATSVEQRALNTPRSLQHKVRADASSYPTDAFAEYAITCGDSVDAGNTNVADVFNQIISTTNQVSQLFGPSFGSSSWCYRWPARAIERFTGPFNAALKSPILVIENTYDPVTPIESAKLMAGLLGKGAVLLERQGYGHTSLANSSPCTSLAIAAFFKNGTLPAAGTKCATDQNPFNV